MLFACFSASNFITSPTVAFGFTFITSYGLLSNTKSSPPLKSALICIVYESIKLFRMEKVVQILLLLDIKEKYVKMWKLISLKNKVESLSTKLMILSTFITITRTICRHSLAFVTWHPEIR